MRVRPEPFITTMDVVLFIMFGKMKSFFLRFLCWSKLPIAELDAGNGKHKAFQAECAQLSHTRIRRLVILPQIDLLTFFPEHRMICDIIYNHLMCGSSIARKLNIKQKNTKAQTSGYQVMEGAANLPQYRLRLRLKVMMSPSKLRYRKRQATW